MDSIEERLSVDNFNTVRSFFKICYVSLTFLPFPKDYWDKEIFQRRHVRFSCLICIFTGGCEGNGNNFASLLDCRRRCLEEPEGKDEIKGKDFNKNYFLFESKLRKN